MAEDEFLAFDWKAKRLARVKNLDYQTERIVKLCMENVAAF